MRKLYYLTVLLTAAITACTGEQKPDVPESQADTFRATLPDTRTYLDGVSTRWSGSEWISILKGSSNYGFGTSDSGASATFSYAGYTDGTPSSAKPTGVVSTSTWALYPYQAEAVLSGSTIRNIWISGEQIIAPWAFYNQFPILVAKSDASGNLSFRNASAILKFTLSEAGVKHIQIKGNDGEKLAGSLDVTFDGTSLSTATGEYPLQTVSLSAPNSGDALAAGTYYCVVAPVVLKKGFTVEWNEPGGNRTLAKTTSRPQEFKVNTIIDLGTLVANGGENQGEGETVTGLKDGFYDISFTATRALSGDVVYMSAQSGSLPPHMTSIQYGTNVKHVIRGVMVTGGSCTVEPVSVGSNPASWSRTSDFTFTKSSDRELLLGGDYSRLNMQLTGGARYKENGNVKDAVDIAADNGWNIVRLRIFNDPGNSEFDPSKYMSPGFVNLDDALRLAQKAKDAGLQIFLSLHYSDYWSDPLVQNIPHEWEGCSEEQLKEEVYGFTLHVMELMDAQGTAPEFISLGNETNSGMFFGGGADGKNQDAAYFRNASKFASFFAEGARAVREVSPSTRIAVHLSNPQSPAALTGILNAMKSAGTDYDIIGISYYPYWTKTMKAADFCSLADGWASTYGRKVMIMETGFNWNKVTYYGDAGQLKDQGAYESIYPASRENQRNYLQELINEVKKSSSVLGLLYWDPVTVRLYKWDYTYYGVSGHISEYDNGTVTQNSALFDFDANRLPAWDAFKYN